MRLYRCLNPRRKVRKVLPRVGEVWGHEDECLDIINRNPDVDFKSGLTGVEVVHKIHELTGWDTDPNGFPRIRLEDVKGRMGYILVSINLEVCRAMGWDTPDNPHFYQPEELRGSHNDWYYPLDTVVTKVLVEKVIDVVPLGEGGK
ncbi:hypothetical protein KJ632_03285 [Patescibacteria group bacterium]|nr:hypothetical protein [Patescibacteria group bacterium]